MAVSETFKSAVMEGSVIRIRIMMKDSMLLDPTFSDFDDMANAAAGVPGLYDKYNGGELTTDKSKWDEKYMNRGFVQLLDNFCSERIDHMKKVVVYLRPTSGPKGGTPQIASPAQMPNSGTRRQTTTERPMSDYQRQKKRDQLDGNYKRSTATITGAVVGGVLGGAVGAAASATGAVITGLALGGAALGAVAAYAIVGEADKL